MTLEGIHVQGMICVTSCADAEVGVFCSTPCIGNQMLLPNRLTRFMLASIDALQFLCSRCAVTVPGSESLVSCYAGAGTSLAMVF